MHKGGTSCLVVVVGAFLHCVLLVLPGMFVTAGGNGLLEWQLCCLAFSHHPLDKLLQLW